MASPGQHIDPIACPAPAIKSRAPLRSRFAFGRVQASDALTARNLFVSVPSGHRPAQSSAVDATVSAVPVPSLEQLEPVHTLASEPCAYPRGPLASDAVAAADKVPDQLFSMSSFSGDMQLCA